MQNKENRDDEITDLTKTWYEIISMGHHKDNDCHWMINKTWSYGDKPVYVVEHYSYIYQVDDKHLSIRHKTYEQAEKSLIKHLLIAIKEEVKFARGKIADPAQWDSIDIEEAEAIIKIAGDYYGV